MNTATIKPTTTLHALILFPLIALLAIPANLWPSQAAESKVRVAAIVAATQVQGHPQQQSLELRALQGFAGEITAPYRNADNSKVITHTVVEILQILLKKHVAQPALTQQELVADDAIHKYAALLKVDIKNTYLAAKGVTLGGVTDVTSIDKLRKEAEEEAEGALTLLLRKSAEYICTEYAEQIRQQIHNENAYLKLEATLVAKIKEISDQYGCDQKKIAEAIACITKTLAEDQSVLAQMREFEQLAQFTGRGRPAIEDLYTKSTVLLECCEKRDKRLHVPQDVNLISRKRPLYNILWDALEQFPAELVALVVGYVPAYFEGAQKETADGHSGGIRALVVLPNHTCASAADQEIKIWNLDTGKCCKVIAVDMDIGAMTLLSSTRLAVGEGDSYDKARIRILETTTGKIVEEINTNLGWLETMILVAGSLVAVDILGHMQIFQRNDNIWQSIFSDKNKGGLSAVDEHVFLRGHQYQDVTMWKYDCEANKWRTSTAPIKDGFHTAMLPAGKIACSKELGKCVALRNFASGKLLSTLDVHDEENAIADVQALLALPQDRLAVAISNSIKILNLKTNSCEYALVDHRYDFHPESINVLALSPDGQLLVSGAWDGTIRFWVQNERGMFECVKVCKGSWAGECGRGYGVGMRMGGRHCELGSGLD